MITHKVLVTLGSLEVYTKHDVIPGQLTKNLHGFYWSDKFEPQDHGPFESIYLATKHYSQVEKLRKVENLPMEQVFTPGPGFKVDKPFEIVSNKLIEVDFTKKLRLN